jgi:hypothetical protein
MPGIPNGDVTKQTVEVGSLYADHDNQRLVRFDDRNNSDGYVVTVYRLDGSSVVEEDEQWTNEKKLEFVQRSDVNYLSGHNYPGCGAYGVFSDSLPSCPDCGKQMEPGSPEYHGRGGVVPIGLICPEYEKTNGVHDEYLTQDEAIDQRYYFTVTDYLKNKY